MDQSAQSDVQASFSSYKAFLSWKIFLSLLIVVYFLGFGTGILLSRWLGPDIKLKSQIDPKPSAVVIQRRQGLQPTAKPVTDSSSVIIVRVFDAITKQPVPMAKLTFTGYNLCYGTFDSTCPTTVPAVYLTDQNGIKKFVKHPGDYVVAERDGYHSSSNTEILAFRVQESGIREIPIELYPQSAQIYDQGSAYTEARRATIVKNWMAKHPEVVNDGAEKVGNVWRVKFYVAKPKCYVNYDPEDPQCANLSPDIHKIECYDYQPDNPRCAIWVDLDPVTGNVVGSGP